MTTKKRKSLTEGQSLHKQVKRSGVTQAQFAEALGLDARTFRRYLSDELPMPNTTRKLVRMIALRDVSLKAVSAL